MDIPDGEYSRLYDKEGEEVYCNWCGEGTFYRVGNWCICNSCGRRESMDWFYDYLRGANF